ncbi:negative elongation factor B-like [Rhopilema esculentum]|uniref:negative elongation factor B-like n=1 Tax=Rhopilema esculentum TaxID=499914 RepID=UPI0031E1A694
MAGFDEAGLPGKQYIKDGFANCHDPSEFINAFQQENCVLLPSLHPALHLLDLQNVPRVNFHQSLLEELRDKLLKRIKDCNKEKLQNLLEHTFKFVHVDQLRPVIMAIMKEIPGIDPAYLDQLADNSKLYDDCPMEVKRQIWIRKHPLFGDAVGPLLKDYLEYKYAEIFSLDPNAGKNFFVIAPRQRRQHKIVKELATMIGKSIELYNLLLQFLRTLFLRTKEVHYCSLRAEILMAFHDADITEIRAVDPCHKFAWCLDACIREKNPDSRRLKELRAFIDGMKKGEEEIIGDVAMIACDPFAVNTLATSILSLCSRMIKTESLPRATPDILFLVRIFTLSLSAWEMISKQQYKEPPLNNDIITRFLPSLASLMLEEQIHAISEKISHHSSKVNLPNVFLEYVKDNFIAATLGWYYIIYLIQHAKRTMLHCVLPTICRASKANPPNDCLLNAIVSGLLRHLDDFHSADYCSLIFDQFLFTWLPQESVLHHSLRLLWFTHVKIESSVMVGLLTTIQPTSEHAENLHELHAKLVDAVASSKASTPSSVEQPNSLSPAISPVISPGFRTPPSM